MIVGSLKTLLKISLYPNFHVAPLSNFFSNFKFWDFCQNFH